MAQLTAVSFLTIIGLLALLWHVDRSYRKQLEDVLKASLTERAAIITQAAQEREKALQERSELYQRIQAPETAVNEAIVNGKGPEPAFVGFDDDAEFWATKEKKEVDG